MSLRNKKKKKKFIPTIANLMLYTNDFQLYPV